MFNKGSKSKSKPDNSRFYLPGEEIRLNTKGLFNNWGEAGNRRAWADNCRIMVGVMGFVLAYAVVGFRLLDTCVLANARDEGDKIAYKVSENLHRADIVDRNGTIVATSLPTQDLEINPSKLLKPKATTEKLMEIFPDLQSKFDETYHKLKNSKKHLVLKRNLTPNQQFKIMAIGNPGLEFSNDEKRVYPHKNLMGHVVGLVDIDNNGVAGLEKGLNERITTSDVPVKLTIDLGVQDTVRNILLKYRQKFSAMGATAILMDAKTAEIVAMVTVPDYDPNNFKAGDNMKNLATSQIYEPGSVLKVFNTAMALESGKVKIYEKFDTAQPLKLKYNTIKEFHGKGRPLSVQEILVYSSNIGSARMALQAGYNEQHSFLERINMLKKIDMELVETARPLVMKEEKWKRSDSAIATIGYGYGLSVSPLHLAAAFAAVVNGGLYNNPTIVSGNYSANNARRVMSNETSRQMRKLLRAVVVEGSGRNANVQGYEVGGKTGTANKQDDHGRYIANHVRTTFMSAFPMSEPKYVLVVMMDDPRPLPETFRHTEAGWNAVPTAAEIIAAVAPQLNVPANTDLDEKRNSKIIEAAFGR